MINEAKAAILSRFQSCSPSDILRQDRPYTIQPEQNLLGHLVEEDILHDFLAGDGGELRGRLPKFCAVHSSAALAANSFGPFRHHPARLSLSGLGGFTSARFEQQLSTGISTPNLDFLASGPVGVVAVESKFTEILSSKKAAFSPAYAEVIERLAEPTWTDIYHSLISAPSRFVHLDAAQLVKHYLGMRHALREHAAPKALLYVFWEPTNGGSLKEFAAHRNELAEFTMEVSPSGIEFLGVSYRELWEQWCHASEWEGIHGHVDALRARYEMELSLPAP